VEVGERGVGVGVLNEYTKLTLSYRMLKQLEYKTVNVN
jgi:hypothetical protein